MKNKKGFIIPLLLAIIAVLVIGGGVYVYSQKNSQQVASTDIRTISDGNSVTATDTNTTENTKTTNTQPDTANNQNTNQDTSSIDWRTYVAGETSFVRPANWQVKDDTYARDGMTYPLFHILSPDKTNLPGYEGKQVHYFIQISINPTTKEVQAVADFQQKGVMNGQSPWNTNISQQTKLTTNEYSIGKHIIDSVIYVPLKNQTVTSSISVQGMSKYTDSNFGFSFWYPSQWKVSELAVTNPTEDGWFQDGSVVKIFSVTDPNDKNNGITIKEFYSPISSITELGRTKSASPVGVDQKYYFDTNLHLWMYENITEDIHRLAGTITPADISQNTMGGLHIFSGAVRFGGDSIVPLSAKNFLVISPNNITGVIRQDELVNTVVASNPAVATPVNNESQVQIVQKEATAYLGK